MLSPQGPYTTEEWTRVTLLPGVAPPGDVATMRLGLTGLLSPMTTGFYPARRVVRPKACRTTWSWLGVVCYGTPKGCTRASPKSCKTKSTAKRLPGEDRKVPGVNRKTPRSFLHPCFGLAKTLRPHLVFVDGRPVPCARGVAPKGTSRGPASHIGRSPTLSQAAGVRLSGPVPYINAVKEGKPPLRRWCKIVLPLEPCGGNP